MTEDTPQPPNEDLESRLREARKRLDGEDDTPRHQRSQEMGAGIALAARIGTELVAAVAVAVGIGLLLDAWLETKPWFLIAFIILGAGAGMMNVFRVANKLGGTAGYRDQRPKQNGADPDGGEEE